MTNPPVTVTPGDPILRTSSNYYDPLSNDDSTSQTLLSETSVDHVNPTSPPSSSLHHPYLDPSRTPHISTVHDTGPRDLYHPSSATHHSSYSSFPTCDPLPGSQPTVPPPSPRLSPPLIANPSPALHPLTLQDLRPRDTS